MGKSLRLGADEWALELAAPGVGEVTCPVVSCRLRDPVKGVADNASRPLNGQAPWNPVPSRPRMPSRMPVARDVDRSFECWLRSALGWSQARATFTRQSGPWRAPSPE